jgi:hypothetical protein
VRQVSEESWVAREGADTRKRDEGREGDSRTPCTNAHSGGVFLRAKGRNNPSVHQQVKGDKVWCSHMVEYYSAINISADMGCNANEP